MIDPYSTRYWRDGQKITEVHHEDLFGRCVPVLDAATGDPANFERRPGALKRCLKTMAAMDAAYYPGEFVET